MLSVGRPCDLQDEEEKSLVEGLITASKWGFPLTCFEVHLMVKHYLDRKGLTAKQFKNNMPGPDWAKSFLKRHNSTLTIRLSENIKRSRPNISIETITHFFNELSQTLEGVPPDAIINYDETNLTDDPGKVKVICRRGTKHVDYLLDSLKASTSVMFSGPASGVMLPVYVVYKSEHLYPSWTYHGPQKTRFNRSKSGWFDMKIFEDWYFEVVLPYFRTINANKKVMIGDNLASHVSEEVIKSCAENGISFVLLPPNTTHLTQSLDVAFFRPLKLKWRDVLRSWKNKNIGTLPKTQFPGLLKNSITVFEDPDDPDPLQPELEIESPLVITIPASNEPVASSSQVNSMSTINMYDSDDVDDDENFKKKT
ncbi:jerky protein homolog-like [Acyrthosiphon pisum]|uniref:DDE-1 domain-containing protein n=1 Tax=Acyrthosiphon pisum TaxID=7029 RepID=A0A8R2F8N9_ACYPI|nr:jerky protein homolog-like [Acyrthosiphon pisum]|eukprot:XP_008183710.1 PREDICTED: jerky protein homolog-like [Acyrthosiphon pisum]